MNDTASIIPLLKIYYQRFGGIPAKTCLLFNNDLSTNTINIRGDTMFTVRSKYYEERVGFEGNARAISTRAKFENESDAFTAAALLILAGAAFVDIFDSDGNLYDMVAWDGKNVCTAIHHVPISYETLGLGGCGRCDNFEHCKGVCC